MPTRNIVIVCSGSHEKKVNLGEVFRQACKATLVLPPAVPDSSAISGVLQMHPENSQMS